MTVQITDFNNGITPTWCPGCGNYGIWAAFKQALVDENLGPTDICLCFDIGCNGNGADKVNAYGFKGLHGRTIPLASGIHLANHSLPVIGFAGDGATFNEGINHLVHAIRSNYKFVFILHNNCDFALTTGQATATTPQGQVMNASPYGVIESRLNPIQFVNSIQASFIARGFSGNIPQLTSIMKAGLKHDGFAYIEILQHCPTYNKFQDQTWLKQRVYDVAEDPDYTQTREKVNEASDYNNDKIATGILFQDKNSVSFVNRINHRKEVPTALKQEVKKYDIQSMLGQYQ